MGKPKEISPASIVVNNEKKQVSSSTYVFEVAGQSFVMTLTPDQIGQISNEGFIKLSISVPLERGANGVLQPKILFQKLSNGETVRFIIGARVYGDEYRSREHKIERFPSELNLSGSAILEFYPIPIDREDVNPRMLPKPWPISIGGLKSYFDSMKESLGSQQSGGISRVTQTIRGLFGGNRD